MKRPQLCLLGPLLLCLLAGTAGAADDPPAKDFEPVRIGTTRAELAERFGEELRPVELRVRRTAYEQATLSDKAKSTGAADPFKDQQRFARTTASSELQGAEYDLFRDSVYRTRWRLAERFEGPLMNGLISRLEASLGKPDYDQTIHAKLGSGKSDLRRTGWRRGGRVLEVRQLHPFTGGPLFVSLSDVAAMDRIVTAKGVVLPQPESTDAWWSRSQRDVALPSATQAEELAGVVRRLVTTLEFE